MQPPPLGSVLVKGHKITDFHYQGMRFRQPEQFIEYPKWVNMTGYEPAIAADPEQEMALLSRPPLPPLPPKGRKIVAKPAVQIIPKPVPVVPAPIPEPKEWWLRLWQWVVVTLERMAA